jgi:hypothetical protein
VRRFTRSFDGLIRVLPRTGTFIFGVFFTSKLGCHENATILTPLSDGAEIYYALLYRESESQTEQKQTQKSHRIEQQSCSQAIR